MSDLNGQPPPDPLERATAALRDAPVPPGPPDDLTAATVAAVHTRLAALGAARRQQRQRRRRIMRYAGFGTAAAAAVAVAVTLWPGGSAAADVDKALDKAEKATSVKVRMTQERDGKVENVRTVVRQGDAVRAEIDTGAKEPGKVVFVGDLGTREVLAYAPGAKVAERGKIGDQEYKMITGALGDFAGLKATLAADPKAVKAVGEEKLGDRETAVFEFAGETLRLGNGGLFTSTWRVWVDPKTGFPVRLRRADNQKGVMTIDYEEWNTKFDAKLFSLDVPDGYKLSERK